MFEQVLGVYCERGDHAHFWGEPANAVTNAAFLVAAAGVARLYAAEPDPARRPLSAALLALIVAIGVGSFLFHTTATVWSAYADTLPIAFFMLASIYALGVRLLAQPRWVAGLMVVGFIGLMVIARRAGDATLAGVIGGSVGYLPAAIVLAGAGAYLSATRHPAGRDLMLAGATFALSLIFRTLDSPSLPLCPMMIDAGYHVGTHIFWHLLNALTLFWVARALIGPAGRPHASTPTPRSA